jgi:GNAT superfamily N-acetyltransferase
MKFTADLTKVLHQSFDEIKVGSLDYLQDLDREIAVFKQHIDWKDMWDIKEAERRLLNNWEVFLFIPENIIKGWYWLDVSNKEPFNLYVNPEYRRKGWGFKMLLAMNQLAKDLGFNELHCYVDDWNVTSQKLFLKSGWEIAK